MSKGNSIPASDAMNALHSVGFLNTVIRGAICDPTLGDVDNHPNAAFFGDVEWYLTCREVSHAGDTFNTYCQKILAEILEVDPTAWPLVKKLLRAKTREEAVESLRIQREFDGSVRKALRESLGASWCGEMEIIAELRNRIVHQAGMDPEGKMRETIAEFPPGKQFLPPSGLDPADFPVVVDASGKLQIDAKTGYWATQHVMHHIHMLDQNLCHRFGLSRRRKPIRKVGLQVREHSSVFTFFPDKPLPVPRTILLPPVQVFELPPFPNYGPMPTPEEIDCAATWRKVREEIHEFVQQSCEDSEVEICGLEPSLAGSIRTHTIEGHDHHLGFTLRPKGSTDGKSKFLGVRLRQEKFQPFITIWGTHTQMRDFKPCELTEQVKEYLHDCINHAISR
jgi:hypothetical protein